jgi:hypothetical protein
MPRSYQWCLTFGLPNQNPENTYLMTVMKLKIIKIFTLKCQVFRTHNFHHHKTVRVKKGKHSLSGQQFMHHTAELPLLTKTRHTKRTATVNKCPFCYCVDYTCKKEVFVSGEMVMFMWINVTITWHSFNYVLYCFPDKNFSKYFKIPLLVTYIYSCITSLSYYKEKTV